MFLTIGAHVAPLIRAENILWLGTLSKKQFLCRVEADCWNTVPDGLRMVVADFAIQRRNSIADETDPLVNPRIGVHLIGGTEGWAALRILRGKHITNNAGHPIFQTPVDVWPLGCMFHYVLSDGSHPFGGRYARESNILSTSSPLLGALETKRYVQAIALVSRMLSNAAHSRYARPCQY